MSELEAMFEAGAQSKTSTDLPIRVAIAAREGDVDTIQRWLAAGGSPDASKEHGGYKLTLLGVACQSCRPACCDIVEILCEAGARPNEDPHGLFMASRSGAERSVRALLRSGAKIVPLPGVGRTALHSAVSVNDWSNFAPSGTNDWALANAQSAMSIGHQGIARMLLERGAEVNAKLTIGYRSTPLHIAARMSGFVSLGLTRELLKHGASLDAVDRNGHRPEEVAQSRLTKPIYTGDGIPEDPQEERRPGAVEAFLALLADVRAAGSFKRYANAPRLDVVVLQALCAKGRASPPPALARLFPTSTKSPHLPREIFWRILSYWRTERDP